MTPEPPADWDDAERYARALDEATDALYVVDGTGTIDVVNEAFLQLTGYERNELAGKDPRTVLHDDDVAEAKHRLTLLCNDETTDSESWLARFVTKNGTEFPVELEYTLLTGADDTYCGFVGRARDVRQQTQQDQKLDILNRALRHNIRNQMNVVLTHATTLQEIDDPNYRTAAATIESVSQNVVNLSEKARKAQDRIEIPSEQDCQIDLVETTEYAIRKFAIKYPNTTVTTELPARAPALAPPSVEGALVELMENATVHHPSGNGPVDVEITTRDGTVSIHVKDACEPIPEAVVETVQRGTEDPLQHNDGLGLWIVRWVADTVRGELSFEQRSDTPGNDVTLTFEALNESVTEE
jgi:PAS domain S-box-containing protein